jgi:hypothetical protein
MALGVTVDFTANIARFSTQIDRLSGDLNRFQSRAESMSSRVNSALGAIGVGLSFAGLASFIKSGIDAADGLNDMSLKTGIAVEKLAGFQLATEQAGTDMDAFTAAANKLNVNMGKNSEAFKQLGIDAEDPAEAFLQLADALSQIEDPQQRAAVGAAALGKNWAEMAPLLLQGGEALRKNVEEGAKLTGITKEMAEEADYFNDQLAIMSQWLSSVAVKVGGELAQGFNQLIAKIDHATQSGITFNNVMEGIGNFAFQNFVPDDIGTLSNDIDKIARKIVDAKAEIEDAKKAAQVKDVYGHEQPANVAKVAAAEQKLNDLMYERQRIVVSLSESRRKDVQTENKQIVNEKTIADFIGKQKPEGAAVKSFSAPKRVSASPKPVSKRDETAQYDVLISKLEKEIALRGETTEVTKLQYDLQHNEYSKATSAQVTKLQQLASEKDALVVQEKQWERLVESANEYYDLKQSNTELINSGNIQTGFNDALANTQDKLKAGDITSDQASAEFNKLGKAYNEEFIEPAKDSTEELSQYSVQAARNMQSAFADFLFDPFNEGMDGLLSGFLDTIRRMASEAASAQIMEGLFGKTGQKDGGGLLGAAFSGLSSSFAGLFHSGGVVGSGSHTVAVSPLVFAGAARYHSGGVVGGGGGAAVSVNPNLFFAAPRFHGGGFPGLKADEVPAILQRGELVISRQQIAESKGGSDLSGIGSLIAKVFHRGGQVGSGGAERSIHSSTFINAPRFHSGGVVGVNNSMVNVSAALFAGAERFHSGGMPGLKPDEVPAILQKGELVLSKSQVSSAGGGGDVYISTNVNVDGSSSTATNDKGNMVQLGNLINSRIREVIATEKRPGGLLA